MIKTIYPTEFSKYVAELRLMKPYGSGTWTFADKSTYSGEWISGQFTGKGALTLQDGSKILGYWQDEQIIGKCVWRLPNGTSYEGQIIDCKFIRDPEKKGK